MALKKNTITQSGSTRVRALKILVVVMGVMLVGGFATLVAVIINRVASKQAAAPASSSAYTAAPLELPAGARIETMAVGPDRLVIAITLPEGKRELAIIDLASGRRLGTIPLTTQ